MRNLIILITFIFMASTALAQDIVVHVEKKEYMDELRGVVNSISIKAATVDQVNEYVEYANDDFNLYIEIGLAYMGEGEFVNVDVSGQLTSLAASTRPITFFVDEVFWNIRAQCNRGVLKACQNVETGYVDNVNELYAIRSSLLADFPDAKFVHIEAGTEIFMQSQEGYLSLLYEFDSLGFDCYTDVTDCHGYSHLQILEYIYDNILAEQSDANLFLLMGAFTSVSTGWDEVQMIKHVGDYTDLYNRYKYMFGGLGVFMGDSIIDHNGDDITGFLDFRQSVKDEIINVLIGLGD